MYIGYLPNVHLVNGILNVALSLGIYQVCKAVVCEFEYLTATDKGSFVSCVLEPESLRAADG
jgi:hypothetical protein